MGWHRPDDEIRNGLLWLIAFVLCMSVVARCVWDDSSGPADAPRPTYQILESRS